MVAYELRRAFTGYEFRIALFAALCLSMLQLCFVPLQYCVGDAWSQWRSGAYGMPPSVWASWIGGTPQSIWSALFYYLVPLLCCAPFASSACTDLSGGLAPVLASRSSAREYALSKMLASCASGVFVFVVPQVLNLLATMLLVPLIPPRPRYAVVPHHLPSCRGRAVLFLSPALHAALLGSRVRLHLPPELRLHRLLESIAVPPAHLVFAVSGVHAAEFPPEHNRPGVLFAGEHPEPLLSNTRG